jgi:hypothetical protein
MAAAALALARLWDRYGLDENAPAQVVPGVPIYQVRDEAMGFRGHVDFAVARLETAPRRSS